MLFRNWKLALLIMLIVPAIAVLTWYFQNKILTWNRQVRKINSKITSGYNEGIMGENQKPGCGGEKLPGACLCH